MKNIFLGFVVLAMIFIGSSVTARAAVSCANPDHPIWDVSNSAIIGCISASAWDRAVAEQLARQNPASRVFVPAGQSVVLKNGTTDNCPWWYFMGCVIDRSLIK